MAANTTPIFIDKVRHQSAALATGVSSLQTLFTPGVDGSRVDSVTFVATAATTPARWQITINDSTVETVIKDGIIEEVTDVVGAAAWQLTVPLDVFLEADDIMKVRLDASFATCGAAINVSAVGGDF